MLGYEWMSPFGAIASHLGDEPLHDQPHECHQILPGLDDRTSFGGPGALFSLDPEPPSEEDYSARGLFGLSPHQLPPAPAAVDPEPAAGSAMRIGLNLGVRTYFASSPDGELMRLGSNVYRRSGGSLGTGNGGVPASVVVPPVCKARCQAEGCGADLTRAKHYHRRHKVCEFHSKAAAAHVNGLKQRFCQQCSRFHVLSEFDQGKRSCRKRLADHNRRRRKTQPPLAPLPVLQRDNSGITPAAMNGGAPPLAAAAKPPAEDTSPGAAATAPPPSSASPTRMALGMCFRSAENYAHGVINCSPSSSSPSSCSSRSTSSSVLHHLPDFGSYYRRVIPMSIWDGNVDD